MGHPGFGIILSWFPKISAKLHSETAPLHESAVLLLCNAMLIFEAASLASYIGDSSSTSDAASFVSSRDSSFSRVLLVRFTMWLFRLMILSNIRETHLRVLLHAIIFTK